MGKGSGDKGAVRTDYFRSEISEPHATRKKQILAKHPEVIKYIHIYTAPLYLVQIENLYGPDIRPFPVVVLIILSQLYLAYCSVNWSPLVFFLVAWSYGGTASHALSLMTHELSHNLIFKTTIYNDYFGIICNIGMGIPSST
jgi:sphingolipid delta-4 desaturase